MKDPRGTTLKKYMEEWVNKQQAQMEQLLSK
jgi:hypothetical protein